MVTKGEVEERSKIGVRDKRYKLLGYKVNNLQVYIVQYRNYSQYFTIILSGIRSMKILNNCCLPEIYIYILSQLHLNILKKKKTLKCRKDRQNLESLGEGNNNVSFGRYQ